MFARRGGGGSRPNFGKNNVWIKWIWIFQWVRTPYPYPCLIQICAWSLLNLNFTRRELSPILLSMLAIYRISEIRLNKKRKKLYFKWFDLEEGINIFDFWKCTLPSILTWVLEEIWNYVQLWVYNIPIVKF